MECQDEKIKILQLFWAAKMRKFKHYNIFEVPRCENANTTALLGCQDENTATSKAKQKVTKTRALYIQTPDQPH